MVYGRKVNHPHPTLKQNTHHRNHHQKPVNQINSNIYIQILIYLKNFLASFWEECSGTTRRSLCMCIWGTDILSSSSIVLLGLQSWILHNSESGLANVTSSCPVCPTLPPPPPPTPTCPVCPACPAPPTPTNQPVALPANETCTSISGTEWVRVANF